MILKDETQVPVQELWIRAVMRDGADPDLLPIPADRFITPSDGTIDLAALPVAAVGRKFSRISLSSEFLPSAEELRRPTLGEGLRVVYLGLFLPAPGERRNEPIARFGHVAMVPRERILWESNYVEAFLVEVNAYRGNSGGPVFVFLPGQTSPKLLGVLKGSFFQKQPAELIEVAAKLSVMNAIGIAAVVPATALEELLRDSLSRPYADADDTRPMT